MSRTIRRKNVKPDIYVTHDYIKCPEGYYDMYGYQVYKWIPLPEKAMKRSVAKFHSDNGHGTRYHCSTSGRKEFLLTFQCQERRRAKEELRKFMLNEEYEVMVSLNKPKTDYWD